MLVQLRTDLVYTVDIITTCHTRNGLFSEIGASDIQTNEIHASQGPLVRTGSFIMVYNTIPH